MPPKKHKLDVNAPGHGPRLPYRPPLASISYDEDVLEEDRSNEIECAELHNPTMNRLGKNGLHAFTPTSFVPPTCAQTTHVQQRRVTDPYTVASGSNISIRAELPPINREAVDPVLLARKYLLDPSMSTAVPFSIAKRRIREDFGGKIELPVDEAVRRAIQHKGTPLEDVYLFIAGSHAMNNVQIERTRVAVMSTKPLGQLSSLPGISNCQSWSNERIDRLEDQTLKVPGGAAISGKRLFGRILNTSGNTNSTLIQMVVTHLLENVAVKKVTDGVQIQ